MATLLSVSAVAVVVGSLRASRLCCLDPSKGASVEKRAYFKVGNSGGCLVRGASPLFSVASEGRPACVISSERLPMGEEALSQCLRRVTNTDVRELCPPPAFWAGWPKLQLVT